MAYPVYESKSTLVMTTAAAVTVSFPATVNANDILLLVVAKDNESPGVSSIASGFTFFHSFTVTGNGCIMGIYYKRAVGTESGTVTHTFSSAGTSWTAGVMYRFSGAIAIGNFWDNRSITGVATAGSPATTGSIVTTGSQRLVVNIILTVNDPTIAVATNYTSEAFDTSTFGADISIRVQSQQVASATTVSSENSALVPNSIWTSSIFAIAAAGWTHNFLGVANANIGEISGEPLTNIKAVNTVE